VDLPGAAVITRNMISYDKVQKIKTTRVSSDRLSDSGNSYGKSTNAAGNQVVHVKRHNTIIGPPDTYRRPIGFNVSTSRVNIRDDIMNKDDINDLLQEIDNEDVGTNYNAPQPTKVKVKDRGRGRSIMREMNESPLVNNRRLEEQVQGFNMDDESDNNDDCNDQQMMLFNDNNDEKDNFQNQLNYDGQQDLNIDNQHVQNTDIKDNDNDNSHIQYGLNDLIDDDSEPSKGENQIQINPMNDGIQGEQVDDLLAEFDW
jgi:hypothetical protein